MADGSTTTDTGVTPTMVPYGSRKRPKKNSSYWYQSKDGKWHWHAGSDWTGPAPTAPTDETLRDLPTVSERRKSVRGDKTDFEKFRKNLRGGLRKQYGGGVKKRLLGKKGAEEAHTRGEEIRRLSGKIERLGETTGKLSTRLTKPELEEDRKTAIQERLDKLTERQAQAQEDIKAKRGERKEANTKLREAKEKTYSKKQERGAARRYKNVSKGTAKLEDSGNTPTGSQPAQVVDAGYDQARSSSMYKTAAKKRGKKVVPAGYKNYGQYRSEQAHLANAERAAARPTTRKKPKKTKVR